MKIWQILANLEINDKKKVDQQNGLERKKESLTGVKKIQLEYIYNDIIYNDGVLKIAFNERIFKLNIIFSVTNQYIF